MFADYVPEEDDTCPLAAYDMEDEYDDTAVIVFFTYVAFTSTTSSLTDMSN
jgi:hypothetical protein